ncbi:EAL domain-containing protein [Microbacteriaceae bacterium 4G12]
MKKRLFPKDPYTMSSPQDVQEMILQEGLLNTIQDLIFIVTVEEGPVFRYMYMNKKAMNHAGLDEMSYGKILHDVLSPSFANDLFERYKEVFDSKQPQVFQDVMESPDKKLNYYESLVNPILCEKKLCGYIVSVTRNITEKVKEKEQLFESQLRYLSLLEYNSDAILSLDISGCIMYANPATYATLGYSDEEMKDHFVFDYLQPPQQEEFQLVFQKALQGQTTQIDCYKYYDKDNNELYLHIKVLPIVVSDEVKGTYLVIRNITEQVLNEKKTEYYAYYDQLTGLLNHISCEKMLLDFLEREEIFFFILINLDEFRMINDTFGHRIGDEVLKELVKRLKELMPEKTYLFRQRGDQFVVIVEETEEERVADLAAQISNVIAQRFNIHGKEFYAGASMGIVMYPRDGKDEKTLFKRADFALERAREHGKGYYNFYNSAFDEVKERQFVMENQLKLALERNEFTLYYQPQINLTTNQVIGMEALIRWHNKELGHVPPDEFIPLAERTGFIFKIDEWVLLRVCQQLREWINKGYHPIPVAINVSAKQFRSQKIVEMVTNSLKHYEVPPHLLAIEITEGALIHGGQSEQVLFQLKEHGVEIHLDDFGTGYSSLSYLKRYPIDTIKIDRSFIREVIADERDAKITTAIIHLAHTLGLEVIAEGVEDDAQIQFLQEKNATFAQGYYFNKPLPSAEFERIYFSKKSDGV